ncbi:MAG: M16 family metallopeptidase [Bacteroidales bacterium]
MEELNRQIPPETSIIKTFQAPEAEKSKLANGIPIYIINSGTEDIIKIDLQFKAGDWFQNKQLTAETTSEMLTEGTQSLSSVEIANQLDYYGAILKSASNKDTATVTLVTLKKHLEPLVKLLSDIVKKPNFPENELSTYIENKKQRFLLERAKVNTLSKIKFYEAIFGSNHPYGKVTEYEDFGKVKRDDLIQFHKDHYIAENCKALITGNTDTETLRIINKYFGGSDWKKGSNIAVPQYPVQSLGEQEIFTPKQDAVQAAIRIGKPVINKHHPDYLGMKIVTTVLGGYFGSRLMKKVREEKGYTYGINAILASFVYEGYFMIASEVGANVCRKAIDAIKQEIQRLKKEKVGSSELEMVKNYLTGELLRLFDGPLSTSSSYLTLMESEVSEDYFSRMFKKVNEIDAKEIIELANKYLNEEDMVLSIAGQCNG